MLRRLPWWSVFVVGALLFLPAVRTGFLLDDYLHVSMVEGTFPAARGPFDLYDFVDDGDRAALFERGLLPWWAHPKLTIRFFRPLSSALLWLDHRVFSHQPLPMHLHSVVWWALAVLAARAFFRRVLPERATTFATIAFALAPCHAMPIAWLANREALVSLAIGTLALGAHLRWRASSSARDAATAAALFALALAAGGEYAIAFGGYVLAMELVGGPRTLARRALGLAPFVVPAVAYLAVRARLGYGAFGSGFYSDPVRAPMAFLREAPWRFAALVGESWLTIDSRDYGATWSRAALAAVVAIGVVFAIIVARRAFARIDASATGAWLVVGSLFAIVPSLAVMPAPRLLGVSALGVAAVVGVVLERAWFAPLEDRRGARDMLQTAAIVLGFLHLVHGPGMSFLWSREFFGDAKRVGASARALSAHVGDATRAEIGVVRGTVGMFFAPFALDAHGRPPARWYVLSDAAHVLALRKDARTLELVAPVGRGLFPGGPGSLLRAPDAPLRAGDSVTLPGLRADVLDVTEGAGARDVVFTFDRDLESIVWVNEKRDEWPVVAMPPRGFGAPFDP